MLEKIMKATPMHTTRIIRIKQDRLNLYAKLIQYPTKLLSLMVEL